MIPGRSLYHYFYLFIVVVWTPLQFYVLHIDNLGRTIALLNIFTLLSMLFSKEMIACVKSKYTIVWLLWIVIETYILFMIKGYHYGYYQKAYLFVLKDLLTPLVVMYVAMYEAKRDWRRLCKLLVFAYGMYVIFSSIGGFSFSLGDRNLTMMGNSLPTAMVSMVFLALMLAVNKSGYRELLFLAVFVALVIIFISGARKSLIAALMVILFSYLAGMKKINTAKIIRLAVLLSLALFVVSFLLKNSFYADRFEESMGEGQYANTTDIKWLSYLGDRTVMYIEGFDFFKENPVSGIGLTNYYYYGSVQQMMHSEYMVQIAECGLIGIILFVLFYGQIIKGLLSKKTNITMTNRLIMIGFMLSCLFTSFTAWNYSNTNVYLIYGIIIAFITNYDRKDEITCRKPES